MRSKAADRIMSETGKGHVAVVGGGLVGPLLAVMMSRAGYDVDVYERRPDLRKTTISGGRSINLALAERGIYALASAGLIERVKPLLIPMAGRLLHPLGQATEFTPYGQWPGEVIFSASRSILNQVLLAAADESPRVRLFFEHECVGIDVQHQTLQIREPSSKQITHVNYERVIGTDGANSAVRSAIVAAGGGEWRYEPLDHDYKELTIPAGSSGTHLMMRDALHIWPRHGFMLIALPNLDGSFTVTLFLNKEGTPSFAELTDATSVNRFFDEYFPDAKGLVPDLADEFFRNPTGALGTVRCSCWSAGERALLLGDAAHGVVPFHGQGMNAGFEDCREWMEVLESTNHNWHEAIEQFTIRRIPQANAIADLALENYVTMRDSVLDPHFQLKRQIGFVLERRFRDRFIPLYSMVMFHHEIPYATARRRGQIQDQILDQLTAHIDRLEDVDWPLAEQLVVRTLSQLPIESVTLGDFAASAV
mgnify:CR=1 FL=1